MRLLPVVAVELLEVFARELLRIAVGQSTVDAEEQVKERDAGLIFVEPGDAEPVSEIGLLLQPVDNQGQQVSLAAAPGPDKEQVVFIVGESALAHHRDGLVEQVPALNKYLLQNRRVGAVRGETGNEFVLGHRMLV